jgi:hypothetical protein
LTLKVDLSAIARAHPVNARAMTLDLNTFDASGLTLIEVLDMSEAAGIDSAQLVGVLNEAGMSPTKARVLYALAWCIVRRAEPDVKFSEVVTWKLDLIGTVETKVSRSQTRARARVNAAKLTGLPPAEAEKLTIAELEVYRQAQPRKRAVHGRRR